MPNQIVDFPRVMQRKEELYEEPETEMHNAWQTLPNATNPSTEFLDSGRAWSGNCLPLGLFVPNPVLYQRVAWDVGVHLYQTERPEA